MNTGSTSCVKYPVLFIKDIYPFVKDISVPAVYAI